MLKKKIKFAFYLAITVCLTFGLSVSLQSLLAAWQAPTSLPPDNGTISAPIYSNPTSDQTIISHGLSIPAGSFQALNGTFNGLLSVEESFPGDPSTLRVTDTTENPALQLQYGALADDHWEIYNRTNGLATEDNSLNIWSSGGTYGDKFTILQNGNVGIGTTTPDSLLSLQANDENGIDITVADDNNKHNPLIQTFRSRGDTNSPDPVVTGDTLLEIWGNGYLSGTAGYETAGSINIQTAGVDNGHVQGEIWLNTTGDLDSYPQTRMVISKNGNVGIGTTTPGTKLQVIGDPDSGAEFYTYSNDPDYDTELGLRHARGTQTTPQPLAVGDEIGSIAGYGYGNNIRYVYSAGIHFKVGDITADSVKGDTFFYSGIPNVIKNMVIKYDGNVGIGTIIPQERLEVNGTNGIISRLRITDTNVNENPELQLQYGSNSTNDHWAILNNKNNNNSLNIWSYGTGPGSNKLTILQNGNVGIGNENPNDKLDVAGDIDATGCVQTADSGSIGGTCISDKNLKENISELNGSLSKIMQLKPSSFEWKPELYDISQSKGKSVGLIAQELEKVFPDLVTTGQDGYKKVRYDIELEMHIIEAIKELKIEKDAEINKLKNEIKDLKALVCLDHPEADICQK